VADEARAPGSPRSGLLRAAGPARRIRAPRLPRRISARTATLVLLLLALAFAYAYPVRVYLAQQAEIDRLEQAQSEQRQRIQQLTDQLKRWDDEQFVISEARRRLHYVREGELVYVVGTDPATDPGAVSDRTDADWFSQLWSSVQAVDNPPVP
jgi:cell division protein FtsB